MKSAIVSAFLVAAGACHHTPAPAWVGPELGQSTASGPSNPSAPLAMAPAPTPMSSRALTGPYLRGGPGDPAPAATRDANNPEPTTLSPPDPLPAEPTSGAVFAPGVVTEPPPPAPTTEQPPPTPPPQPAPTTPPPAPVGPGTGNAPIAPR